MIKKLNHDHDKFQKLNGKNHEQYHFLALRQHHSIEIMNIVILGVKFNLFWGKKSCFIQFCTVLLGKYPFLIALNHISITFQSHLIMFQIPF